MYMYMYMYNCIVLYMYMLIIPSIEDFYNGQIHYGPCFATKQLVLTMEPLYCGHHWDKFKCPDKRGVLFQSVRLVHVHVYEYM